MNKKPVNVPSETTATLTACVRAGRAEYAEERADRAMTQPEAPERREQVVSARQFMDESLARAYEGIEAGQWAACVSKYISSGWYETALTTVRELNRPTSRKSLANACNNRHFERTGVENLQKARSVIDLAVAAAIAFGLIEEVNGRLRRVK
ncbi:MAG: hypothetical protein NTY19_01095 [Planctomycetota bacterium]|nr:hypothetical protein [Planctomycetota bacterium]